MPQCLYKPNSNLVTKTVFTLINKDLGKFHILDLKDRTSTADINSNSDYQTTGQV
jgi:hypothetical protein